MALVTNNTVRKAYDQAVAAKTRIAPHDPIKGLRASRTGLPRKYGTVRDKEKVRHESGQGERKPTHGPAEQYLGKGRAMTTSEKKFYSKIKEEGGGTFKKPDSSTREGIRNRVRGATTTVRKHGVGTYISRNATAEDLNKSGKLPTNTLEKEKIIARFKRS